MDIGYAVDRRVQAASLSERHHRRSARLRLNGDYPEVLLGGEQTYPGRAVRVARRFIGDVAEKALGVPTLNARMEPTAPRLPNFFLLGAARCGTTTLSAMLRKHPDIFLAKPKEPSFFCRPFRGIADPISYAELFEEAGGASAVGDASHVYLSHPDAARTIRAFFPTARFVLILRNPADRAYSLFCWAVANGWERHGCFEDAWAAEDSRASNPRIINSRMFYGRNLLYFNSGLVGQQLQRYLEYFPIDAFHVTTLARLSKQPNETIGEICDFLGVGPTFADESVDSNQSQGVRSVTLQWLARNGCDLLRRCGIRGTSRAFALVRYINRGSDPLPLKESTRARLLHRYADDLTLLHRLTGIDLAREEP